jgi:hypothetical protein
VRGYSSIELVGSNKALCKLFMAESDWLLNPGEKILRRDLHDNTGDEHREELVPLREQRMSSFSLNRSWVRSTVTTSTAKVGLLHRFVVNMFGLEVDSLSYRTHLPFDSKVATLPFGHMPNHP